MTRHGLANICTALGALSVVLSCVLGAIDGWRKARQLHGLPWLIRCTTPAIAIVSQLPKGADFRALLFPGVQGVGLGLITTFVFSRGDRGRLTRVEWLMLGLTAFGLAAWGIFHESMWGLVCSVFLVDAVATSGEIASAWRTNKPLAVRFWWFNLAAALSIGSGIALATHRGLLHEPLVLSPCFSVINSSTMLLAAVLIGRKVRRDKAPAHIVRQSQEPPVAALETV